MRNSIYHAGDFQPILQLDNSYCVRRECLKLLGCNMDNCVSEQFTLAGNLHPLELFREAVVAQWTRWKMDFAAFEAFPSHQLALSYELVELLNRERLNRTHQWSLL